MIVSPKSPLDRSIIGRFYSLLRIAGLLETHYSRSLCVSLKNTCLDGLTARHSSAAATSRLKYHLDEQISC